MYVTESVYVNVGTYIDIYMLQYMYIPVIVCT